MWSNSIESLWLDCKWFVGVIRIRKPNNDDREYKVDFTSLFSADIKSECYIVGDSS